MNSRDKNANRIAITVVPEKPRPGIVIPKAMDTIAPRDAPELTPMVEPSASGFFSSPCMAAPHSARHAPTSATHSTRGMRTERMMDLAMMFGISRPETAAPTTVSVSRSGILTLPTHTHRIMLARVITENSK